MRFNDLTGQRFGKLTVVSRVEGGKHSKWLCACDCGNEKVLYVDNLKNGKTLSCGCMLKTQNGLSRTRLGNIWRNMLQRCYDSKYHHYEYYGGKGISVCNLWKDDLQSFYDWAIENGYKEDLTIDRINVTGNYEPSNCRWTTMKEQANNRSNNLLLEINGRSQSIDAWSKESGLSYNTIYSRYFLLGKRGEELLQPSILSYEGKDAKQLAEEIGISLGAMYKRLSQGLTGESLLRPRSNTGKRTGGRK